MAEKGTCRVCNRPTKLTAAGVVAAHGTGRRGVMCNGAGHAPQAGTRFATATPGRLVGPWEPAEQPEPARKPICTCPRVDTGAMPGAHTYVLGRPEPDCPFHGEQPEGSDR